MRFEGITDCVLGAAIAVHRELGPGFLEALYERALCVELGALGVAFESQVPVPVFYKGARIGLHKLDLLIDGLVVVELKAVEFLTDTHEAQLRSYLRATGCTVGLLLNFNRPTLAIKRQVL